MENTKPRTRRQRGYRADVQKHDSPEEIDHARQAEDLRKDLLDEFGITPEKCVPTGDGKGYVRFTFDQVEQLMYAPEPED